MLMLLLVAALLAVPATARAQDAADPDDLTSIDLEGLMQLEVTSVSRHEEPLFRAASAIFVITAEDIARSGATNIPDLLRSVPGMNVAQINGNTWAVGSRGFNGLYANKLLVLVDGRTVYSPVFSGVDWDAIDVLLEDVQRIEVIRGPGATAWGANAVNGVINVITKPSSDSPGLIAIAGGGTRPSGSGALRYAGTAGPAADFRVFAKHQVAGRLDGIDGEPGHDGSALTHAGGRLDWQRGERDRFTFQGDYYGGTSESRYTTVGLDSPYVQRIDLDIRTRGGNLMAAWQRAFSPTSDLRLKGYFDRSSRSGFKRVQTFDVDFQHRLALGQRHDIMWGGGYRITGIDTDSTRRAWFEPADRTSRLGNVFIQDAIAIVPQRVTLTLGTKIEHNSFTGFEVEPGARVLWAASPTQTVWGAASRAVRTPGPVDESVRVNISVIPMGPGMNGVVRVIGTDMRSEVMTSLELGYRARIHPRWSIDLAGYSSRYTHLRANEPGTPFFESDPAPPHMVIPYYFTNGLNARTRGLEGTSTWRPSGRFDLNVSHALSWMKIEADPGSSADPKGANEGTPTYQLAFHPHVLLAPGLHLDATWYHVDDLGGPAVPAYDRVDARLGWTATPRLELAGGIRNLFHDQDLEYRNTSGTILQTLVRTGVYGKVTWRL